LVQPPGEGSQIDFVTVVYGATRVEIGMSQVGADHAAVEALTRDVHARATGAPVP
jgi:hypothetical protein